MQTQLKILNYIVVVGTTLVMFDIATTQDLPIFCLEQLLHFLLFGVWLLSVPSFEKTHLTVDKHAMSFLSAITLSLSDVFALP